MSWIRSRGYRWEVTAQAVGLVESREGIGIVVHKQVEDGYSIDALSLDGEGIVGFHVFNRCTGWRVSGHIWIVVDNLHPSERIGGIGEDVDNLYRDTDIRNEA